MNRIGAPSSQFSCGVLHWVSSKKQYIAIALLCGVFWEMWKFYSLAKWVYHVPFVQRFHVFEMSVLGYAGYLPFGLECIVVAEMVLKEKVMSHED